jgi:hypothetical protein
MTTRLRLATLGSLLLYSATCAGCGGGTELVPLPITSVEYREKGDRPILTIDEFPGPRGARSGNTLPGRYVVKGKYDLTGTKFDSGVILLSISGSYELQLPDDGKGMTDEQIDAATTPHFEIPKGQPKGSFELTTAFKKVNRGPGIPTVSFWGNQRFRIEGGTTHEAVEIR